MMNELVERELVSIESGESDHLDQSVRHIYALLEHCHFWTQDYGHLLTPELQTIRLNDFEEQEIVQRLAACIRARHPRTGSLFFAIGKASRAVALQPLVDLLADIGLELSDDDAYQALIALENCWILRGGRWTAPPELEMSERERLRPFLMQTKAAKSTKLCEIAERTFNRVFEA